MKGRIFNYNKVSKMGQIVSNGKTYNFNFSGFVKSPSVVLEGSEVSFNVVEDIFSTRMIASNIVMISSRRGEFISL